MSEVLIDQAARDQALDVSQSFIVQAPAGSGKTGLLTLRYLRLLAISEQPEQVLAITFTRKAASEMRDRIIQTLQWALIAAEDKQTIHSEYDRQRLEIALEVIKRDQELQWRILENPSRLRVQTIDSFCFYLASQLPVLSRIGGNPIISEDVEQCFRDAIRNTLQHLETEQSISTDIERVLVHLDNDISRLERLLIDLLKKRDQWLPYVLEISQSGDDAKNYLETCLHELTIESIQEARTALEPHTESILELTNFAISNLQQATPPKHVAVEELTTLPGVTHADLNNWRIIVDLLLTQAGDWRRMVDKRNGFPPGSKDDKEYQSLCKLRKQQFNELRDQLNENDDLLESLNYLRLLPEASLDSDQWNFLTALTRLLARLSSELIISFRRFRLIDYTETGAAARAALGEETNPTDLALALDHNIQHILVDEFQDTSQLQLDILQQLISGWEPNDQHSLFLVGDAMQSCYGFRNANVGIYLNVQQNGLRQVNIVPLQLQVNFRSDAGIVDWINRHFVTAFPANANPSRGAVPYSSSAAIKSALTSNPVSTELISYENGRRHQAREAEAKRVIHLIKNIKQQAQTDSIAILVRSRNHLDLIVNELRANNIEWTSTDIDRMGAVQIVEDLLSLTKAIINPFDRLSWLAILRAPWTGLQSSDLLAIAKAADGKSIWTALGNHSDIPSLSSEAKQRLNNFVECISPAMKFRYRVSIRELVVNTWELLRGAAVIDNDRELACVNLYFNLISAHETAGGLNNLETFQEQVFQSFIPAISELKPTDENAPVQLLTMHKAKGLEFDHVIIPGLANRPGSDDKPLFTWHERLNSSGQARLFVAALTATGAEDDSLYTLLRHEKQHKTLLENTRLLYIAITRAKKSAKLLATVPLSSKDELRVPSQSLLGRLWREIKHEADGLQISSLNSQSSNEDFKPEASTDSLPLPTPINRLSETRGLDSAERDYLEILNSIGDSEELNEIEATEGEQYVSARIGELIHDALEDYANSDNRELFLEELAHKHSYWALQLRNLLESKQEQNEAIEFIENTVRQTVTSKELSWIFAADNSDCHNEFPISSLRKGKMQTHVIDRTFIDAQGIRWIIDYKTGAPGKQQEAEFLDAQLQQHTPQLIRYQDLFSNLDSRTTRIALLFTAIPKLVEIHAAE